MPPPPSFAFPWQAPCRTTLCSCVLHFCWVSLCPWPLRVSVHSSTVLPLRVTAPGSLLLRSVLLLCILVTCVL